MKRTLLSRIKQLWASSRRSSTQGFTLLELLVVSAIGAGIMAGLMFIVVQLMETDQRESSRSETQREMQLALDYISAELREAVYVYTGEELVAKYPYLPESLTQNSIPVIAFWKQQPFPEIVKRDVCQANRDNPDATPGINCESSSSYALVVYSLSVANSSNIWSNNARITRYALTEFESDGDLTQGYVNPGTFENGNGFRTWPIYTFEGDPNTNVQLEAVDSGRPAGRPEGRASVLVDFVNVAPGAAITEATACPADDIDADPNTPDFDFKITPSDAVIAANPTPPRLRNVRSFYACLDRRDDSGQNQEVIVYLQGSVNGRPGYTIAGFGAGAETLPTLEARVLTRGVIQRRPR